jgi:ketosteroid isomerase-like protein
MVRYVTAAGPRGFERFQPREPRGMKGSLILERARTTVINLEVRMRNVRFLLLLILPVFMLQACGPSEPPGPTLDEIQAEVRARSEAVVAAEEAFDWETAVTFFAPDVIVQPANAPQYQGREAHLEVYRTFPAMLEFDGRTTAIVPAASGDMAYEYGVNHFVFDTPDGPVPDSGKYLVVWQKLEGEWYITAFSFSGDTPPQG